MIDEQEQFHRTMMAVSSQSHALRNSQQGENSLPVPLACQHLMRQYHHLRDVIFPIIMSFLRHIFISQPITEVAKPYGSATKEPNEKPHQIGKAGLWGIGSIPIGGNRRDDW
ncbi:MAG TPA: hypothetical protein QF694_04885 [Dehalococcoidia bacterium]|nr:hypothetical protein [Dehalococcoidia bacterium]MDP7261136.1 hypothetical protein [Dehalococcoidia bacterium]MDP7485695.1 hypothetical protein [Dehalococcoidia bacterium]HJP28127.1 hypothetical protein [Dehalococcoidia bacterium]